jgi:hypothetical protein
MCSPTAGCGEYVDAFDDLPATPPALRLVRRAMAGGLGEDVEFLEHTRP